MKEATSLTSKSLAVKAKAHCNRQAAPHSQATLNGAPLPSTPPHVPTLLVCFSCCFFHLSCCFTAESSPTLLRSHVLQPARLLCPWDFPGKNTGVSCRFPLPKDLSNPGIEPRSAILWADSLPAEPQGKPKNTGVGSLFFSPADLPDPGIELSLKVYWLKYYSCLKIIYTATSRLVFDQVTGKNRLVTVTLKINHHTRLFSSA